VQEGSLPIAASSKPQPSADPRLTALFEDANLLHLLFKFEKMNVYRIDDLNYLEKQDISNWVWAQSTNEKLTS